MEILLSVLALTFFSWAWYLILKKSQPHRKSKPPTNPPYQSYNFSKYASGNLVDTTEPVVIPYEPYLTTEEGYVVVGEIIESVCDSSSDTNSDSWDGGGGDFSGGGSSGDW